MMEFGQSPRLPRAFLWPTFGLPLEPVKKKKQYISDTYGCFSFILLPSVKSKKWDILLAIYAINYKSNNFHNSSSPC